jgi:hypothetical protein
MNPAAHQVMTSCCGTSTGQKQPATHSSPRASSISYCTHLPKKDAVYGLNANSTMHPMPISTSLSIQL